MVYLRRRNYKVTYFCLDHRRAINRIHLELSMVSDKTAPDILIDMMNM